MKRKLLSLALALMMIFAFSATAFAAAPTQTGAESVTVYFTEGNVSGSNSGDTWMGGGQDLYGSKVVDIDSFDLTKAYIPDGTTDPMGGAPSVLDAIITAAEALELKTPESGWDAYPYSGDPGAYLSNVNNTTLISNYWVDGSGVNHATGTGFYVATAPDGSTTPTIPSVYVSNVAVSGGMVIYVDLGNYNYTW